MRARCLRFIGAELIASPMTAVVFSLVSAVLFGGMAVALVLCIPAKPRCRGRRPRHRPRGARGHRALSRVASNSWGGNIWPFLVAGLIAPGGSQLLYVRAVKEVGASRAAVVVGAAPLVAVTIALTVLGEPAEPAARRSAQS